MSCKRLKIIFILIIPIFLFVVSPFSKMVCKMEMSSCEECCSHCHEDEVSSSSDQSIITAVCCFSYQSQTLTAFSLNTQKTEDFSNYELNFSKIVFLSTLPDDSHLSKSYLDIPYYSPATAALFVSKHSFLI